MVVVMAAIISSSMALVAGYMLGFTHGSHARR